jgi:Class II flagellar assembly regulator
MVESVRAARTGGPSRAMREVEQTPDGGFVVPAGLRGGVPNAPAPTVPSIGLESMLTLQAVDEAAERDRGARRHGAALIAALSDLQRALLASDDPAAAMRLLTDLAAGDPGAHDPGLAAILRAVILRARVEVARRARA